MSVIYHPSELFQVEAYLVYDPNVTSFQLVLVGGVVVVVVRHRVLPRPPTMTRQYIVLSQPSVSGTMGPHYWCPDTSMLT